MAKKPTDKERLDWLLDFMRNYSPYKPETRRGFSRRSIDLSIRAEKKSKRPS